MISVRVKLVYPEELVRQPIIARLSRAFGIEPNIRRANVEDERGWIVCELDGEADAVESALRWLRETGVEVELLGDVMES